LIYVVTCKVKFDTELIHLILMVQIEPQLLSGNNVMIAAHGNSLRSIIMYLDKLTSQEVIGLFRIIIAVN
jgi:bisphosphoglycerate-dependent phosphoglycerate mutase